MRPSSLTLAALALGSAALGAAAGTAGAQGSLSGQGFGYPPGQLSTRALGSGGGLGEFDPTSPLNPASTTQFGRTAFAFQYDPEFRTTTVPGGGKASNTIARFPVVALGVPFRRRFTVGLSASTFLDRSFQTRYTDTTAVGGQNVEATELIESRGAISDLRLGVGAYAAQWLQVGVAVHGLTGNNRVVSGRQFTDTTQFGSVNDSSTIEYRGLMYSAGAIVTPVRGFSLAGSVRRGGSVKAERNDSVLTRADAPDRYGVGLRVDRITGATLAVSYARTTWSRMKSLGTAALDPRDADEFGGGVEAVGPSLGAAPLIVRAGARRRTLPFAIGGSRVRETNVSGGLGLPLAGGRALADLALQRSSRTPEGGTSAAIQGSRERAYTLSLGFTIRP